jgi:hypothetical protein
MEIETMTEFKEEDLEKFYQGSLRASATEFFALGGFSQARHLFRMGYNRTFLKKSVTEVESECLELFKELGINKENASDYQVEILWTGEVSKVYEYQEIWCNEESLGDEK